MKIGIIGAGQIGGTLVRRLTTLGHDVSVANSRGPETLATLAKETGARPVNIEQAAHSGDLVIVALPLKSIPLLPPGLFDGVPDDVVVVDTGNYYPKRDQRIDPIESGATESRWVSDVLRRPVIKVFNTIYADHLLKRGQPAGTAGRIALPVAGDDQRDKEVVIELLDELGFDGVDAGSLDESWRQQPGSPVYGGDLDAQGVRRGLSEAKPERPAAFRAAAASPVTSARR